jgi:hypothetical protein
MQLDQLVKMEYRRRLNQSRSVSVFSDGWSDLLRRFWVDVGLAFIDEDTTGGWLVEVVDCDLIFLPGAVTGNVLETVLKESVDEYLSPDCLIATSTSDGGGDERKAAFQLVLDGNDWWCAAHRIQLAIDDCLDGKKRNPPADCAPFRSVVKKAHDLVVYVNGHRATSQALRELSLRKREVRISPIVPSLRSQKRAARRGRDSSLTARRVGILTSPSSSASSTLTRKSWLFTRERTCASPQIASSLGRSLTSRMV